MPLATLSLKGRALRLLGSREHSRSELERKLARHEQEPGELARTLDELQAKGLINEQRVIESVLYRHAAKRGTARLKQELLGKGLPEDAVAAALVAVQRTEHERALALWNQKFGTQPTDLRIAARQMRFLSARGFSAEAIRRIVKVPASS